MGKKKRRTRKSVAARRRRAARAATSGSARPSGARIQKASRVAASSKQVDFAAEYGYLLGDLKRIAILAAAMFAVLGILALTLH